LATIQIETTAQEDYRTIVTQINDELLTADGDRRKAAEQQEFI
jgi:hypothetical protein